MARATAAMLDREIHYAELRLEAAQAELIKAARYLERMTIARDAAKEQETSDQT